MLCLILYAMYPELSSCPFTARKNYIKRLWCTDVSVCMYVRVVNEFLGGYFLFFYYIYIYICKQISLIETAFILTPSVWCCFHHTRRMSHSQLNKAFLFWCMAHVINLALPRAQLHSSHETNYETHLHWFCCISSMLSLKAPISETIS